MQLLLLLLSKTYLLRIEIKIDAAKLLLLNKFVFTGGRTMLLMLLGRIVRGEGRSLGC